MFGYSVGRRRGAFVHRGRPLFRALQPGPPHSALNHYREPVLWNYQFRWANRKMKMRRGRRLGDGKRAICGREPDVAVPGSRFPTDAEWQILQDKLAFRLSGLARSEINTSSVFYWLGAPQSHSLINVATVSNSIEKWRRKTTVLRNIIWKQPIQRSAPSSLYDQDRLRQYFTWHDIEHLRYDPLSLLAAVLDGAIVASNLAIAELNNSDSDINETLNWYLWVSYLIYVLRKHQIPAAKLPNVTYVNRHSRKRYGVILFIYELQKIFLPVYRRRKTVGSIQKGIKDAMFVTRGIRPYLVTTLLTRWMLGESLFFNAPLAREYETGTSLRKVRARIQILKNRRTRNRKSQK
jgi:hypothetical protein